MLRTRKFLRAVLAAVMVLAMLSGCESANAAETTATRAAETTAAATAAAGTTAAATAATQAYTEDEDDGGTWAVYMYICGSNLESRGASATKNLLALMNASDRTSDTIFLAETGGASQWNNNFISADRLQRWLYTDGDMDLVDEQENASMSTAETLTDFLDYAFTNYPADHTMVILWDHGGGTLWGCCIDENYGGGLSLQDVHAAFENVCTLSESNPPIDILGFDCCLMATIDVADLFKDTAKYLVASEETEPSLGWDYESLGNTLGNDPTISAHDLGVSICDSYITRLQDNDQADEATLSLINLRKISRLTTAFNAMVDEMIVDAYNDPTFFKEYAVDAGLTENYGGNSRAEGYYDLIDIRNFAENASDVLQTAPDVLTALSDCVEHQVFGEYRSAGGGLSFYYDYDGYDYKNDAYIEHGTSEALKVLYTFGVEDEITDDTQAAYMRSLGLDPDNLPLIQTFQYYDFNWKDIQFDENGAAYCDFGSEVSGCITDAMYYLYYEYDGNAYKLGSDDEVHGDFNTGVIKDQSLNNWGYLGGYICYMELTYDSDDYNLYSIPVLIDGDKYFLQVAYDYSDGSWEVLGARFDGGATAMSGRALYLEDGTEVTLLAYIVNDDGGLDEVEGGTFTYQNDSSIFEYKALPEGTYYMRFVIEDLYANRAYSDSAEFTLKDGVRTYIG